MSYPRASELVSVPGISNVEVSELYHFVFSFYILEPEKNFPRQSLLYLL
jgi:hypothetical protein